MKGFIQISLVLTIFAVSTIVLLGGAFATQPPKVTICHCEPQKQCLTLSIAVSASLAHLKEHSGDYIGACKEITPTPSPRPSCTPTPTPTVVEQEPTETPIPTPTQEPTPPAEEHTTGGGSSTPEYGSEPVHPNPSCTEAKPSRIANINVRSTGNKGELLIEWALPLGASKAHIEYGLGKQAQHALLNTDNDGNEVIRNLVSGKHYWFRVMGVNGCAVGEASEWFDPIVP